MAGYFSTLHRRLRYPRAPTPGTTAPAPYSVPGGFRGTWEHQDASAGRYQAASASILAAISAAQGRIRRVRAESAPTRGPSGRRWARVRAGRRRAMSGTVTAVARGAAGAVSGALGAAPPASHGRRWPTSSAAPGTAPAPSASGRARAPTRSTRSREREHGAGDALRGRFGRFPKRDKP